MFSLSDCTVSASVAVSDVAPRQRRTTKTYSRLSSSNGSRENPP